MTTNRRTFVIRSIAGAGLIGSVAALNLARAQTALPETDPTATTLGYKADATKTDKTKFPKYAVGQQCNNCALYQGKPADASGGCPLFAGKTVTAKGWCGAWAKKA
ncbi:MAG: iron permease [Burkholderiales bacterium PBB3]|nr:MAG: iron permease [Burkholderiales bacterium PBB3]